MPFVIQASFDEVFRKDYKLKGQWAAGFFKNQNPVVLEIGCGKGEYTVGMARLMPDRNFIGIDIKGSRIHDGATRANAEGLKNVAFIRTRVELLNSFFSTNEIDEIWITFPDPQLNRARKRLVSARFLNLYALVLRDGGTIHLKTDSRFLYTYTKLLAETNGLAITNEIADLNALTPKNDLLEITTYYEKRFADYQISIKYLSFILVHKTNYEEPVDEVQKDLYHNAGMGVKFYESDKELPRGLGL